VSQSSARVHPIPISITTISTLHRDIIKVSDWIKDMKLKKVYLLYCLFVTLTGCASNTYESVGENLGANLTISAGSLERELWVMPKFSVDFYQIDEDCYLSNKGKVTLSPKNKLLTIRVPGNTYHHVFVQYSFGSFDWVAHEIIYTEEGKDYLVEYDRTKVYFSELLENGEAKILPFSTWKGGYRYTNRAIFGRGVKTDSCENGVEIIKPGERYYNE
jgi:hypothetical protein